MYLSSFSNSGHYYATVGEDGKLRVWDVTSCVLFQEYVPDVHLTSPFTELLWITYNKIYIQNKKRKFSEDNDDVTECDYLILGTLNGEILIYSVSTAAVVETLKGGHSSKINSVTWNKTVPYRLFSCSADQYIVEWDLNVKSVVRKWKSGKMSSITLSSDGKSLLCGCKDIKWWDISNEETLVKSFIGHQSDVTKLLCMSISNADFVLSCSKHDRQIKLWTLDRNDDRQVVATFNANDCIISLAARTTSSDGIIIAASTKMGLLHIYDCVLNGKNRPVSPKLTVQIAAESETKSKLSAESIPIVNCRLDDESSCHIAYGQDILSFEILDIKSPESTMFIVRQDPRKKMFANKELAATKILPATKSKNMHYVHPETVNGFVVPGSSKAVKRGHIADHNVEVPLELRLDNLAVNETSTNLVGGSPDSLVHLLLQGLRSKDVNILHDVLIQNDESVIKTTVAKLPVEAIIPFSTELITLLQGRLTECDSAIKWLRCIIHQHAAYLISSVEMAEIFAPLFPIIEGRFNMLKPLYKLQGRLDSIIEQIEEKKNTSNIFDNISTQPVLTYQDEDSDEEDHNVNSKDKTDEDSMLLKSDDLSMNESDNDNDDDFQWDEMSEISDNMNDEEMEENDKDENR